MYIRRDKQKLKRGSHRTYLSLAHNVWVEGPMGKKRAKPVVFANLGAEEELDVETVRSMRDAFDRYLARRLREAGLPGEEERAPAAVETQAAAKALRVREKSLRVLASRSYGLRMVLEPIWESLGLKRVLEGFAAGRRLRFPFERVVFGMVLNRLVDPKSKRACNEWLQTDAYFPEAEGWQVDQFYRALDLLESEAEALTDHIEEAVAGRLDPEELRLLLLDTTSSYFASDLDDVERAAVAADWEAHDRGEGREPRTPRPQVVNTPPLRLRGHSKDKRSQQPQVVVGLVCGAGGALLRAQTFPGNQNDQGVTLQMLRQTGAASDTPEVVVMDSGMAGTPNLAELDTLEDEVHRVSAVPLRKSKVGEAILARPGRWRQHPDKADFRLRVVRLEADEAPLGRPELWLATRNLKAKDRQERRLERHLTRVKEELARCDRLDGHGGRVCKLLSHRTLKRYVRPSKDGKRLLLDRDRIAKERRRAGVRLLRSTLVDHPPETSLRAYEALLDVESDFRTFKGPLRLRPMHHRKASRIRAHVLVCALALVCLQELQRRTGRRFAEIAKVFDKVRVIDMVQGDTRFWQRTEWGTDAKEMLEALGVPEGPRTWGARRHAE
jgi:hypothetical protein